MDGVLSNEKIYRHDLMVLRTRLRMGNLFKDSGIHTLKISKGTCSDNTTFAENQIAIVMDGLLGRVKDVRVFKHVSDIWERKTRSTGESQQTTDGVDLRAAEKKEDKDDSSIEAMCIDSTRPGSPIMGDETLEVLPENNLHHEDAPQNNDDQSILIWDPMDFIDHCQSQEEQDSLIEFPLTSKFSEIFTFNGQFGYQESALSLTNMMVWQMNKLFRSERKELNYNKEMGVLQAQKEEIHEAMHYLTRKLEEAGSDVDKSRDGGKLEEAQEIDGLIQLRQTQVLEKMQLAHDGMEESKAWLFNKLKRLLEGINLLDPPPPEHSLKGLLPLPEQDKESIPEIKEPEPPTPSEAALIEQAIERQKAEQEMYEKEVHLHDIQPKLEHWHDYYEARFME